LGVIEKETKTEGSNRTVPFPEALESKLRLLKADQSKAALLLGKDYIRSGYVVTYTDGRPTAHDNRSGWFRKFIERHGLRKITFHGLRHTYATLLIHSKSMPEFAISKTLGHSDTSMLTKTYAHQLAESGRKGADFLDELVAKAK
jgi:integrase